MVPKNIQYCTKIAYNDKWQGYFYIKKYNVAVIMPDLFNSDFFGEEI